MRLLCECGEPVGLDKVGNKLCWCYQCYVTRFEKLYVAPHAAKRRKMIQATTGRVERLKNEYKTAKEWFDASQKQKFL